MCKGDYLTTVNRCVELEIGKIWVRSRVENTAVDLPH